MFSSSNHKLGMGFFLVIIVLIGSHGIMAATQTQTDFKTILKDSYIRDTVYEQPNASQLSTAQALFERLLETLAFDFNDVIGWGSLGLFIRKVSEGDKEFALISEFNPAEGKGHGFYAINLSWNATARSKGVKFLQAPHRPSDLRTYEIVAELFTTGNFLAAAWSTTHRDSIDLGKETMSYFNAFSLAAAGSSYQPPHLVQLHGFAKSENRRTDADVIFSSTLKPASPLPDFNLLYNCLKTNLGPSTPWGFNVYKYPDEIDILGGTLNINARNFYSRTSTGIFYHVETSRELRELLISNNEALTLLETCIIFN